MDTLVEPSTPRAVPAHLPPGELDDEALGDSVTVAYINSSWVTYSWHHSMVELIGYDLANNARLVRGGYVAIRYGPDGLVEARNKAIEEYLKERTGDWLFWVDTDMGFAPDTVDRLLAAADPSSRPAVGALCFSQREMAPDTMGGWRCTATPTVFDWAQVNVHDTKLVDGELQRVQVGQQQGFTVRWDYPANTLVRVAGTGSACLLIHRSVFERIRDECGPVWYNRVPNASTGQLVSEDLSFCLRMGAYGIPLHVHTGVRTTHQKTIWLGEEDYWRQRAVDPSPVRVEDAAQDARAMAVPQ